jgi:hypothetical protein
LPAALTPSGERSADHFIDIKKVKAGIEAARRLGELLGSSPAKKRKGSNVFQFTPKAKGPPGGDGPSAA